MEHKEPSGRVEFFAATSTSTSSFCFQFRYLEESGSSEFVAAPTASASASATLGDDAVMSAMHHPIKVCLQLWLYPDRMNLLSDCVHRSSFAILPLH